MSEYQLEVGVSVRGGSLRAKISGRKGCPPPAILHVGKTRTMDLSHGKRMLVEDIFRLSGCTCLMDKQKVTAIACSNSVRCMLQTHFHVQK